MLRWGWGGRKVYKWGMSEEEKGVGGKRCV